MWRFCHSCKTDSIIFRLMETRRRLDTPPRRTRATTEDADGHEDRDRDGSLEWNRPGADSGISRPRLCGHCQRTHAIAPEEGSRHARLADRFVPVEGDIGRPEVGKRLV